MRERLVLVEWLDHSSTAIGWEPVEKMRDESLDRCVTIGKVIGTHRDRIVLASSWVPGRKPDQDVSHVSIIARRCIVRMRVLSERNKQMPAKKSNPKARNTTQNVRRPGHRTAKPANRPRK